MGGLGLEKESLMKTGYCYNGKKDHVNLKVKALNMKERYSPS